jgi:SAM-dependent methyltransferase
MDEFTPLTKDERFDLLLLRSAVRYQRWILSGFGNAVRGQVLEVGAGIGNMTRWLAQRADVVTAVEPDAGMSKEIEQLELSNVEVVSKSIEAIADRDASFDSAVLVNVLEHVADDVGALKHVCALLRPGGQLCILVPAHEWLYGSIDRTYGHVRRYRRREMAAKMQQAGFELSFARYFNPVGAIGWFLVGKLGRQRRLNRWSIALTERLAIPVGHFVDRLGGLPFGQSVLAVGIRPRTG